ncbi:MAG: hypothetical protein M3548_17970 [Actinomycetota bacterium]|nr:hypothetical protein [Actinomycetota bacterium]
MDTTYYSDGLTESAIDGLLAELDAVAVAVPVRRSTSPFADQVADERRERRERNRQMARFHRSNALVGGQQRQGKSALSVSLCSGLGDVEREAA